MAELHSTAKCILSTKQIIWVLWDKRLSYNNWSILSSKVNFIFKENIAGCLATSANNLRSIPFPKLMNFNTAAAVSYDNDENGHSANQPTNY